MSEQIALVTNVTAYAGLAAAVGLAEAGFRVVCHDRAFSEVVAREAFAGVHPLLQVTPAQEPGALIDRVVAEHGTLDVLVSNDSCPATRVCIEDASLAEYRATLEALLGQPFMLIQAVVPHMKQRRNGRIILVTSAAPLRPYPEVTMYTSARGGASALAQSVAKELAPFNIQVNAIAPNFFQNETYFPAAKWEQDPAFRQAIERQVPLKRLGQPEEMGALIAFLASGKATFVTGQVIAFTGGWWP